MSMTELEAVYARHSVRSYLDKAIEPEKIRKLQELIDLCNAEGRLHLQFLADAGGTFNRLLNRMAGLGSAPSVIACIGPDDGSLEDRVGYYGERIVLLAQQLGLNTCWAGTFNAKNVKAEIGPGERLCIVIAIGYGATQGKERKSKNAEQVSSGKAERPAWFTEGVKLALLAPTAINQQRFEFVLHDDETVSVTDRRGPFSKVDVGIVKYHFDLARKEAGLVPLWGN